MTIVNTKPWRKIVKKIAIIGSGASGKSTLSKELSEIYKLPIYHLDIYFWKPDWIPIEKEKWIKLVEELVAKQEWIIDGNYQRTMDIRLKKADMVIFLDFTSYLCIFRALKRRIQNHGRTRIDMGEGCKEKVDYIFLKWIWNFRRDKRPGILIKLKNLSDHQKVHIYKSPKELRAFISQIRKG